MSLSTSTKRKAAARKWRSRRRRNPNLSGGKIMAMKNTLVPDRLIIPFSYKDNISLTPLGTAVWSYKTFRLNSIYDPDYDLVNGHQPLGYDQWSVFYNRYRVYKAKVSVTIMNEDGGGVQVGLVGYNAEQYPMPNTDAAFEQPHTVSKVLSSANGMNKTTLTKTFDIPRIRGNSHLQYKTSPTVAGIFGANPNDQVLCSIITHALDDLSQSTMLAQVQIVYYCELFDRRAQNISVPAGKDPEGDHHPN